MGNRAYRQEKEGKKRMIDFHEVLAHMNTKQRINYDKVFQQMEKSWQQEGVRPRILLHSCCGPCSSAVLERLVKTADVTVYYMNPNIHPEAEYRRREYVQQKLIHKFNAARGTDVHFLAAPYDPSSYFEAVKGQENEPEGGARCRSCFHLRMLATARKMKELGFDYFATTLTVSSYKNSQVINAVGMDIEEESRIAYLPSDFKKHNGYLRSTELSDEFELYRQHYCGCIFGARDQGIDLTPVNEEARQFMETHDASRDFPELRKPDEL